MINMTGLTKERKVPSLHDKVSWCLKRRQVKGEMMKRRLCQSRVDSTGLVSFCKFNRSLMPKWLKSSALQGVYKKQKLPLMQPPRFRSRICLSDREPVFGITSASSAQHLIVFFLCKCICKKCICTLAPWSSCSTFHISNCPTADCY